MRCHAPSSHSHAFLHCKAFIRTGGERFSLSCLPSRLLRILYFFLAEERENSVEVSPSPIVRYNSDMAFSFKKILFSRSRRKKKNAEQRYERWLQDFFPQSVKLSLSLLLWCILPAFVRFNCVSSPMSFFE